MSKSSKARPFRRQVAMTEERQAATPDGFTAKRMHFYRTKSKGPKNWTTEGTEEGGGHRENKAPIGWGSKTRTCSPCLPLQKEGRGFNFRRLGTASGPRPGARPCVRAILPAGFLLIPAFIPDSADKPREPPPSLDPSARAAPLIRIPSTPWPPVQALCIPQIRLQTPRSRHWI